MNITTPDLLALIDQARAGGTHVTSVPFHSVNEHINEYLLFLKPEVTATPERLSLAWNLITEVLEGFEQQITAIAAAHSSYLQRHRLIEAHYGVINEVSRRGLDAISGSGQQTLDALRQRLAEDTPVLGGHQFIERYAEFTPEDLAKLYDSLENIKFAGGTYGVVATVEGERVIILNGFHPQQIAHFYAGDRVIVLFVVQSHRSWLDIREKITGATDPAKAVAGSIRARLLAIQDELGYEVATARNGVHVSAGPIEAAVEISRYMSNLDQSHIITPEDIGLVNSLVENFGRKVVRALLKNAVLQKDSAREPAFDVTEEVDAWSLTDVLRQWRLADQ